MTIYTITPFEIESLYNFSDIFIQEAISEHNQCLERAKKLSLPTQNYLRLHNYSKNKPFCPHENEPFETIRLTDFNLAFNIIKEYSVEEIDSNIFNHVYQNKYRELRKTEYPILKGWKHLDFWEEAKSDYLKPEYRILEFVQRNILSEFHYLTRSYPQYVFLQRFIIISDQDNVLKWIKDIRLPDRFC